jgi:hypothetical protein
MVNTPELDLIQIADSAFDFWCYFDHCHCIAAPERSLRSVETDPNNSLARTMKSSQLDDSSTVIKFATF